MKNVLSTLADVSEKRTGVPAGMTSRLTVATP